MNLTELHPLREPALLVAALLAPAVQTGLLVWAGLDAEAQAVWNAVAAAVAGLLLAALAVRDRLAPAIVGLASAVLALGAYYGWGLSVEQETAVASLVSLATGLFLRTQITARVDANGQRVTAEPPPVTLEEPWPYADDDADEDADAGEPDEHLDTGPVQPVDDTDAPYDGFYEQQWEQAPSPLPGQTVGPIEGRRMAG